MRALLLLLVGACYSSPAPSSPAAPPARSVPRAGAPICARPAGTERLLMAAAEATTKLKVEVHAPGGVVPERWQGKLVVDGTVTSSQWPEQPPSQYELRDGRTLLYDAYNANLAYLWDPDRRALTELGRSGLVRAGDGGTLLVRTDERNQRTYLDIDPDRTRPRLRPIWSSADVEVETVALVDGELAVLARESPTVVRLTCVYARGATSVRTYELPAELHAIAVDAVRDHRLLLLGPDTEPPDPSFASSVTPPFTKMIWVLELETGRRRELGIAQGSYTRYTAIPHPYVRVQWKPSAPVARPTIVLSDNLVHEVDPATEVIRP